MININVSITFSLGRRKTPAPASAPNTKTPTTGGLPENTHEQLALVLAQTLVREAHKQARRNLVERSQ